MNHNKLIIVPFTLLFLFIFFSCEKEVQEIDEEFYIPVQKSNLFVRVVGNPNKPIIIDLHGGPGGYGAFNHEFYRNYLEEDYLLIYLDQRGCGKSDAEENTSLLTMEQYVEDLDVVVDTFKNKYKNKKINLFGSSWGGTYGLLYLINHQEKINAFVCASGKANSVYQNISLIEHEEKLATQLMEKSINQEDKMRFKEILIKLAEIKNSGFEDFYENMTLIKYKFPAELGFNPYWKNLDALEKEKTFRKNPTKLYERANYTKELDKQSMIKGEAVNKAFRNTPTYNNLNIIDDIATIKTPVLVIQGEYDYVVGIEQASMIYDALKNVPMDKKELVIIPNVAHNLTVEAPDNYFGNVKSFFDNHNK
jgi:pimeloyl-ACP methyl ester carboxylesterase